MTTIVPSRSTAMAVLQKDATTTVSSSSGTYYGWSNFTQEGVGEFDLSPWAGETVDIRFRLRSGFEGSIADDNESLWSGRDGYAIDNITIYKQNTAYFPNPQTLQQPLTLTNLGPGEEETASISANLLNDTIYRISATLSNHAWDEQSVNDDIIGYIQPFNLYDPAVEGIDYFNPGGLYAEGMFDIDIVTNNWGNTMVDFDIEATVFSATPSDVLCSAPAVICKESFEGGAKDTSTATMVTHKVPSTTRRPVAISSSTTTPTGSVTHVTRQRKDTATCGRTRHSPSLVLI